MAGRLRSIAKIVIIDVAAPLIAYSLLRSVGMSTVTALVLSGVFPHRGWPSAPSSTAVEFIGPGTARGREMISL